MDVVSRIRTFNAGRDPLRLQLKYSKMRGGPFAFLRGTCHLFYDRLPRGGIFKSAPLVWVCGDLHLENFGSYKGDNRLVYFDVCDFDEAALAPLSWDLVRFLTSLRVGVDSLSIGASRMRSLCQIFLDAYAAALVQGKACWVERETATGLVRQHLDDLRNRARSEWLDKRTVLKGKTRRLRIDDKKALVASAAQRARVTDFMRDFAKTQPNPDFYKVLDVARRIAGTGSLGVERYVILIKGKGSPDGNYLLDLKQTLSSSLVPHLKTAQPRWTSEAQRVVDLQCRVQAVSMAFLHAVLVEGRPFVLRGLQPSDDTITLDGSTPTTGELEQLVAAQARIVAWDHLRGAGRDGSAIADELIDFGRRKKWKEQLFIASQDTAAQVRKDAATYDAAWDEGVFACSEGALRASAVDTQRRTRRSR